MTTEYKATELDTSKRVFKLKIEGNQFSLKNVLTGGEVTLLIAPISPESLVLQTTRKDFKQDGKVQEVSTSAYMSPQDLPLLIAFLIKMSQTWEKK